MRPLLFTATLEALEARSHEGWEQARFVALITARAMGAKADSKDFQFPWEQEKPVEVSKEDTKRMIAKLNELKAKEK